MIILNLKSSTCNIGDQNKNLKVNNQISKEFLAFSYNFIEFSAGSIGRMIGLKFSCHLGCSFDCLEHHPSQYDTASICLQ